MKIVKLLSLLMLKVIKIFRLIEFYQPSYNPHGSILLGKNDHKRNCEDRFNLIKNNIEPKEINSYLDIGSQIGYFVFKMAELNPRLVAQGVEMERVSCAYANNLTLFNGVANVSFINAKMSVEFARAMPSYDLISFLSVFHHIAHFEGFTAADSIMQELHRKCQRYFIFETGQYDEKGYYWSESLKFMGEDPLSWINEYLRQIGYKEVRLLATVGTHLSENKRGIFLCRK
ncbi:MAG: class I SAM-dependent methyltransferase [bacterium]|nr:class I SAM-dependent methyltransferase [bacterium]